MKKVIQKSAPRGGVRPGAGRPKIRTKKRPTSFKLPMRTIHTLNRFAKARSVSRAVALELMVSEHEATLNREPKTWTWGGEQTTFGASVTD